MARYQIWNQTDTIYTPSGATFTPEQWKSKYSWINSPFAVPVVSGGVINGAFIGELSDMRSIYEKMGADFSDCVSNEDVLAVIEAFEDAQNSQQDIPSPEERIAAAMEYQVMASLPDDETEV